MMCHARGRWYTDGVAARVVEVPPYYVLVPPQGAPAPTHPSTRTAITLAPGVGFGDGTHPTTQLCLQAVGYLLRLGPPPARVLDFGAGNGVLAIAAALGGAAQVEAVEIDPRALEEAAHNAALNGVSDRIALGTTLRAPAQAYDLVVANILCGVLVDFAEALATRVGPAGRLVLSGLTSTDVPVVLGAYRPLLPNHTHRVYERGEWRAVMWT